ncbi:UPF0669 protein v1g209471 [Hydra vulgaris]|uniref:UPF0669 protein v1g209471 n=1 Tax=Hydra vulgaris TaxID=6087 RepID=A0ABM4CJT6_HYDVU
MNVYKMNYGFVLILIALQILSTSTERILFSISSEVGAGNYSIYKLEEPGDVTIVLKTLIGDADLYVSEFKSKADFMNYDLSSATCGLDIIGLPHYYSRPTFIAVYGHVHSPTSKYKLTVIMNYSSWDDFHLNSDENNFSETQYEKSEFNANADLEDIKIDNGWSFSSVLWGILETFLKILLEVVL